MRDFPGDPAAVARLRAVRAAEPAPGALLLDSVERFLSRFVAYPSEAAKVASVLWTAHTHAVDRFESTPRLAYLSPEPGSGKSRALEVLELLCPRPIHAVNATPAYLFRKVSDDAGLPTILFDEIDTVFGPKAKENEEVRGMLNAGHRRGAVSGRCVIRGKTVDTEELPAFCAVALAGLGDMPDTIMSRSIVIRMRRRAPDEPIEAFRHRVHASDGHLIRDRLAAWAGCIADDLEGAWPKMPDGVQDRAADVWEPLLAVADAAGGEWPHRARVAAVSLVTQAAARPATLGIRLLEDVRTSFNYVDGGAVSTETLLTHLHDLDESVWADLRGKPLDARGLAKMLGKYDVKPTVIRLGAGTVRGYRREDLHDAWSRYLPPLPATDVTGETAKQPSCPVCDLPVDPTLGFHPACEPAA